MIIETDCKESNQLLLNLTRTLSSILNINIMQSNRRMKEVCIKINERTIQRIYVLNHSFFFFIQITIIYFHFFFITKKNIDFILHEIIEIKESNERI